MKIVLSNKKWFLVYIWLRSIIILVFFISILSGFLLDNPPLWLATIRGVFFSFFLLMIIFEIMQKPSYLNVGYAEGGKLNIALFIPDTNTFFYFNKRNIQHFVIDTEDKLELLGVFKKMPWQQKLQMVVSKPNGEKFQSEVMDVSWASKAELQRFYELAKAYS